MSQIGPLLPYVLLISLVASVTGAIFYALARFIESKWRLFPLALGIPLLLFMLYALLASEAVGIWNFVWLFGFVALSALGGWFHLRAGGASASSGRAMFLMLVVNSAAQIVGAFLITMVVTRSSAMFRGTVASTASWSVDVAITLMYVVIASFCIYPTLVPLGVWVWRSMKLRPGIDIAASDLR